MSSHKSNAVLVDLPGHSRCPGPSRPSEDAAVVGAGLSAPNAEGRPARRKVQQLAAVPALIALGVACGLASLPARASTIAFDIQSAGSVTQPGFTAVTSFPKSDGTVTLDVDTTPSDFRDRGISAPIDGNLYAEVLRDLAFWSTTAPITFTFSGLQPNTEYSAKTWVFDNQSGNNGKNIDFTTSGGTISLTTSNTSAVGNPYSLENLTADGDGTATIVMDHTGGAGGAVSFTNGFELVVVPEPAGLVVLGPLLGLGSLHRLTRRRRGRALNG
jgi:hypothetical protein